MKDTQAANASALESSLRRWCSRLLMQPPLSYLYESPKKMQKRWEVAAILLGFCFFILVLSFWGCYSLIEAWHEHATTWKHACLDSFRCYLDLLLISSCNFLHLSGPCCPFLNQSWTQVDPPFSQSLATITFKTWDPLYSTLRGSAYVQFPLHISSLNHLWNVGNHRVYDTPHHPPWMFSGLCDHGCPPSGMASGEWPDSAERIPSPSDLAFIAKNKQKAR